MDSQGCLQSDAKVLKCNACATLNILKNMDWYSFKRINHMVCELYLDIIEMLQNTKGNIMIIAT